MAYVTEEQIKSKVPASMLVDALDDDRDGAPDPGLLEATLQAASSAVDALVGARYAVPFATAPAAAQEAALVFACEMIFDRRQITERNPFRAQAERWRDRLALVGEGLLALQAGLEAEGAPRIGVIERCREELRR